MSHRFFFPVDQVHSLRLWGKGGDPFSQVILVRVTTERTDPLDLSFDREGPPHHADLCGPVQDIPPQGAPGLVTHEEHSVPVVPDVVLDMMPDPAPGTHSGAREDHRRPFKGIDHHRVFAV
jgi:hypothetical protein